MVRAESVPRSRFHDLVQFQIGNTTNQNFGEGFAFVIQNNPTPVWGFSFEYLGYEGIPGSLAVEFDLVGNAHLNDPAGPHIAVHTRGRFPNTTSETRSIAQSAFLPQLVDGNVHTAWISYSNELLQVWLDDSVTPVVAVKIDLVDRLSLDHGQAWVGFTGATSAAAWAVQEILSWSLELPQGLVTITSPIEGSVFPSPARVEMTTGVLDTNRIPDRVEYWSGRTLLGSVTNLASTAVWTNVPPGTYTLTAVAYDSGRGRSASLPRSFTVLPAAAPVGINFAQGYSSNRIFELAPSSLAGVVAQSNWNNVTLPTGKGQALNLKDGEGKPTGIDAFSTFSQPFEAAVINAEASANHRLMKSYLQHAVGFDGTSTKSTIILSNIVYARYDLLLYSDRDNFFHDHVCEVRVGEQRRYLRDARGADFCGVFVEGTGRANLGDQTSAGNYVRFNGLTNPISTLEVSVPYSDETFEAVVNAVQLVPSASDTSAIEPVITRGPYLQLGATNAMRVRWRTDLPCRATFMFGTNAAILTQSINEPGETTEHEVELTGLMPQTRYCYRIDAGATTLAAGQDHSFVTSPMAGRPTRIWVLGDSGTANNDARAVRDSYYEFSAERPPDLWLMLGDNAYVVGTDEQYQNAVFNIYPEMLRQSVLWPTIGNHDTAFDPNPPDDLAYFRIFTFPVNAEAGGMPSGTEKYYSYDYGNIHFVCLDSMSSDRSSNGMMAAWLESDLAHNSNEWLIAYWHHPPYSKGSHDSDIELELIEMRQNILPILERHGVDLVLTGHSHSYERSFFLHGHYGDSTALVPSMILDGSGGQGSNGYEKAGIGAVYAVAGSSGQISGGTLDHPAMFVSLNRLGSLVLDVNGGRLEARFVTELGEVLDSFVVAKHAPEGRISIQIAGAGVTLRWLAIPGRIYQVEAANDLHDPVWRPAGDTITAEHPQVTWSISTIGSQRFFRVVRID